MGAGASATGYVDSVDPITSLNENEGEIDLQLATTNILRSHMLRLSQLGKIFVTACKDGESKMMVEDFIKYVKRDPISRVFTTMPAKYTVEGSVVTFGDIYKQIIEEEKGEPKEWVELIKYFKMAQTNSEEGIKFIRNVFDKLDKNNNGKVSKSEFLVSLQNDPTVAAILGLPAIVKEQEDHTIAIKSFIDIFDQIDKDADLEVNWEEFLAFFVYHEADANENVLTTEVNNNEEEKVEVEATTTTTETVTTETVTTETVTTEATTITTDENVTATTTTTTTTEEEGTSTVEAEPTKEEPTKEEPSDV